jgi:hypothetical protein
MTRKMHYWAVRRPIPNDAELIPIREYAESVHLSVAGIRSLIAQNRLKAYKINRQWFLPKPKTS